MSPLIFGLKFSFFFFDFPPTAGCLVDGVEVAAGAGVSFIITETITITERQSQRDVVYDTQREILSILNNEYPALHAP